MKICIPTHNNTGMEATVSAHFGSAGFFTICDTETGIIEILSNDSAHRAHGSCEPVDIVGNESIDAVICSGIGQMALDRFSGIGIKVYSTDRYKVKEVVDDIGNGIMEMVSVEDVCRSNSCQKEGDQ